MHAVTKTIEREVTLDHLQLSYRPKWKIWEVYIRWREEQVSSTGDSGCITTVKEFKTLEVAERFILEETGVEL